MSLRCAKCALVRQLCTLNLQRASGRDQLWYKHSWNAVLSYNPMRMGFWAHISQELWKGHGLKFQSGFKKASYENLNCQKLRALKLSTEKSAQMKQTQICLYLPGSSDRMLQSWTSELKRSECPTKNQTLTAQYLWLEPSRRWRANLVNSWVASGVALADPILCTKSCFSTTCIVLQINQMSRKCQQSTGSPWPPSRFHMVPHGSTSTLRKHSDWYMMHAASFCCSCFLSASWTGQESKARLFRIARLQIRLHAGNARGIPATTPAMRKAQNIIFLLSTVKFCE